MIRRCRSTHQLITTLLCSASAILFHGCTRNATEAVDVSSGWRFSVDSLDVGIADGWYRASYADSAWSSISTEVGWEAKGFEGYDGVAWYRRTFEVPDLTLRYALFFRKVDDEAQVWLNGKAVTDEERSGEAFVVRLGENVSPGKNVLSVRVVDHGGPGGLIGDVVVIPEDQLEKLYKTPYSDEHARPSQPWVHDAVIYEVYLRSFSPEGTFEGLRKRIPELKDLGVTVIWLMPIHPTGERERKGRLGSPYSVRDYYAVNPEFGTEKDLKELVSTVHENGMHIILDLVANHTAWDNPMLEEHPEWYTTDAWGLIQSPNRDWFDVADLNFDDPELRAYMMNVMRYWVEHFDIDGYRADVADLVPLSFWEQARAEISRIKPVMMLAEGALPQYHVGAFDITYAWNTYDMLQGLVTETLPASTVGTVIEREHLAFPEGSLRLRFNTNHDKNAWDEPAITKFTGPGMKLTSVLMFTLPGVPLLYNGQEVGNPRRLDLFDKVDIDWTDSGEYWPFYRNLTRMRREHPVFVNGRYELVSVTDSLPVFSFARTSPDETALVALNFGSDTVSVTLSVPIAATPPAREYFTGERFDPSAGMLTTGIAPKGFKVFLFTR